MCLFVHICTLFVICIIYILCDLPATVVRKLNIILRTSDHVSSTLCCLLTTLAAHYAVYLLAVLPQNKKLINVCVFVSSIIYVGQR